MSHKSVVAVLVITLLASLAVFANMASGCQEGKPCNNPLPTNDGKNGGPVACDPPGGGKGPEHKCLTPTAVQATATPTATSVQATATPTATPVQVTATPTPTDRPQESQPAVVTVEPTVTKVVTATAETQCGVDAVCDPCALLLEALAEGRAIIISADDVTIIENGKIQVAGEVLATGKLPETR